MSDDIAEGGSRVRVRRPDGEHETVPYPHGFAPAAFRNVLGAYVTAFRLYSRLPSTDEVHEQWPRILPETVGEIMATTEFRQALVIAGIEPGDHPGLSALQHAALLKMADPLDHRKTKAKLDDLGVSSSMWANWLRHKPFARALDEQSKRLYTEYAPMIRSRMVGMAEDGNFQAMDRVLEEIGEGPKSKELANAREVVLAVVQAVQRHCTPEQREAIMADVKWSMQVVQLVPAEIGA